MSKICFSIMVAILFIAGCNYIKINNTIENAYINTENGVRHIDSVINCIKDSLIMDNRKNIELNNYINDSKNYIKEIESLKDGVFDSNVITFLVSFLLVFLGGILFNIEERAKKQIKTSETILENINVEYRQMEIYIELYSMFITARNLQGILISNNYGITNISNVIINDLFVMAGDLSSEISKREYDYMTLDIKNKCTNSLKQIITILENEQIVQNNEPELLQPLNKTNLKISNLLSLVEGKQVIGN